MERIRQLRNEKGLSQAKLAVMADMDPATLNRLEQGKGNPNLKTIARVADALGVEVVELFPKAPAPPSRGTLFSGGEEERREPKLQGKPTAELQQIALEEARFTKPQNREELTRGHKEAKAAQLDWAHRRTVAYANIAAINAELGRRGARLSVELIVRRLDEALSAPDEQGGDRENQEGQKTG